MVAFGVPVVPDVKPNRATSSLLVATASNLTGFSRATRSSALPWLAEPSNSMTWRSIGVLSAQVVNSSISRVSHNAWLISALSIIFASSPARSIGIVLTTTAPALVAANQHATIAGLLAERIKTRLPGLTPKSSTNACASRLVQSVSSL